MEDIKYYGVDNKGELYEVKKINWENMTALCKIENVIGWVRCRFENFIQQDTL